MALKSMVGAVLHKMVPNKNVKHRYMPSAFRWTRSCVARRLHWRLCFLEVYFAGKYL
jgi:hypothetical protein